MSYQSDIAACDDILNRKYGVVSDLLDGVKEWVTSIDFATYGKESLDAMYHYVVETLLPALSKSAPDSVKIVLSTIIIPLLQKLHDAYLPHPA